MRKRKIKYPSQKLLIEREKREIKEGWSSSGEKRLYVISSEIQKVICHILSEEIDRLKITDGIDFDYLNQVEMARGRILAGGERL